MPKFSIIMPVYSELTPRLEGNAGHLHYRGQMVQRAIKSVIAQQYPDWELILVDDGCCDIRNEGEEPLTVQVMKKFADSDSRIRIIHQENQNRAIARNNGMDHATGDWICWLDCDDEYSTHYLREMDQAIKDFPEYKVFNTGAIVHWPDHHTSLRSVFAPGINEKGTGHEWFKSGQIGTGSFIFRRDMWAQHPEKYRIPDEVNPYQFAAASHFDLRITPDNPDYPYIENPEGAFSDGIYRHGLSLGNPWGDDVLQFYLLTRDNLSKPLDVLLYIQYPRAHEEVYEHFGAIYDI